MDESAKLSALQKAYAEIIMNVSKEAACRVMASEKKRLYLQQELSAVKDEGLHMLMRLKQMLDCKTNEAQITSISQRKRIDELEAQLDEAEYIVEELRGELREARAELAKGTDNRLSSLIETCRSPIAASTEMMERNKLDTSKCYSPKAYIYAHSPDFSTSVMGIQAFGRGLYGRLSLSGNKDNFENGTQRRGETDASCTVPNLSPDQPFGMEEDPDDLEVMETVEKDGNSLCPEVLKPFLRKRKRTTRYRKGKSPLRVERQQAPNVCLRKSSPESRHALRLALDTEQMAVQPEHLIHSDNMELLKPCTYQESRGSSKLSIGSAPRRQERGPLEALIFPVDGSDGGSTNDLAPDKGVSNILEPVPENWYHGKSIKYTFQRRRRKEKLRDTSVDCGTPKIEIDEEPNVLEGESSLMEVAEQLITLSRRT